MSTLTHDATADTPPLVGRFGLGWALVSAASFGMSGALGRGLMDAGWSAGAAIFVRVLIGALVLAVPAVRALRGRWGLLRRNAVHVLLYGGVAVALCQVSYFSAAQTIPVGIALLIEYLAPVAVVVWVWLVHGRRPRPLTYAGGAVALGGLVLVLDVTGSGGPLDLVGVGWALLAMVGAATYFVLSADEGTGLPPVALAGSGMLVGASALGLLGLVGVMRFDVSTTAPTYPTLGAVPVWLPLLLLGVVTAATSYLTGIEASRRLGSRVASFVALSEVLFAMLFAWLLLAELPRGLQLVGGLLVLVGVVVVKAAGEDDVAGAGPPDLVGTEGTEQAGQDEAPPRRVSCAGTSTSR